MFFVYILQNPRGRYYIGQTNDLDQRLERHNCNRVPWTKNKGPWTIIYSEEFSSRTDAMKREKQLKKWRRELIVKIISRG